MSADGEKQLLLGKIVGLFGVDGWVKLESYTEPRTQIFKYRPWKLKNGANELEIAGARGRTQGKGVVASLPEILDRETAVGWIGAEIWIPRSALPKPKRGEFYWADLEGLQVVTTTDVDLGRVSHVFATGANDVLVAKDSNGRERMIPFVTEQYVIAVDFDNRRITVDWDPDF